MRRPILSRLAVPALVVLLSVSCSTDSFTVSSPDGKTGVSVSDSLICVFYNGRPVQVMEHGLQQIVMRNDFDKEIVEDSFTMISGKSSSVSFSFRQYLVRGADGTEMLLRVADDGVAVRFADGDSRLAYRIPDGTRRWLQRRKTDYEGFFPLDSVSRSGQYGYPALFEYGDGIFGLVTESGVQHGNSCSFLTCRSDAYEVTYTDQDTAAIHPWRVLILGHLSDIVESDMVSALASDCRIEDTSWIEPGLSSWIYWAYNHSSKDYSKVCQYIDLASEMGWPYTLIDWEWDEMAGGGNIDDALAYARKKGVKVNLWYNSGTSWTGPGAPGPQDRLVTAAAREREMTRLEEMGATGIKVDFFLPDGHEMVDYYLDILEDAARHHLLVDFHGCTVPRGWSRTWPNLMSMEAVYGAEWYNNNRRMTAAAAAHNATLPFTRNVIGPMDYTPCTFTDSQNPHITTDCHELALPILFESGLQHMADRPSAYLGQPSAVRELLSGLPSAWDETLLLAGYPGQYAVIARRSGTEWYIAGINGTDKELTVSFTLDRLQLPGGNHDFILFADKGGEPGAGIQPAVLKGTVTSVTMYPRGGFVMFYE